MELFKLFGIIALNNSEANEGIDETTGKAGAFGEKLKAGMATVAKWGAAIGAAAAAGSAALFKIVENTAQVTDNVDKMSQKIGISREAYQELDFVCSQSGTSVDTLQMGVKTLTNQMQSAAAGTKSAVDIFNQLGISIYDTNGNLKDQETMMWEAMAALQGMENQTEKAAIANDLFGRSGSELMPLLNGASGSIEAMRNQAHELGLVLSDEAIDAGVKFTDTLDQAKRALSAIGAEAGAVVMPIFQELLEWVLSKLPQIKEIVGDAFQKIIDVIGDVGEFWREVLEPAIAGVGEAFGSLVSAVQPIFSVFKDLFAETTGITEGFDIFRIICWSVEDALEVVANKVKDVAAWIGDHSQEIQNTIKNLWEEAQDVWKSVGEPIFNMVMDCIQLLRDKFSEKMPEIREFVSKCFNDIRDFWNNNLKPCFDAIGNFIENVLAPIFELVFITYIGGAVDEAFNFIKKLWDGTLKPVFTGITDFLTGVFTLNFSQAFQGLVNIVKGIWNGIIEVIKRPINSAIGMINNFIGGLNKIKIPDWVPGVGGKGINIPTIPYLEKGGILERGQVGFLEGNGAEAVVPLDQNKKWISAVAEDMNVAIGGDNEKLQKIVDLLETLIDILPVTMIEAFKTMKFDVNNREFARLVKAVN